MITRSSIDLDLKDTSKWPSVTLAGLDETTARLSARNIAAITSYFGDEPVCSICRTHGMVRSELVRLRDRCLETHPDGRIWGYRAAIAHAHVYEYCRTAPIPGERRRQGGCAGVFNALLRKFPSIKKAIDAYALNRAGPCHESRPERASVHRRFIGACLKAHVRKDEYPFCVKHRGKNTIGAYLKGALFSGNLRRATDIQFGEQAAQQLDVGLPGPARRKTLGYLDCVQGDAHLVDAMFTIYVPHPKGGVMPVPVKRFWLINFTDEATTAELGYYVSFDDECTAEDVVNGWNACMRPWKPRRLSIRGLRYDKGAGFPNAAFPEAAWGAPSEILLDNALEHIAPRVRQRLVNHLHCAVNFGMVGTPQRRALKERLYGLLEQQGFQRLPNTTGMSPRDPRRRDPEKAARRFHIGLDELLDLVDVLLANRNARPSDGLAGRTPLEQVEFLLNNEKQSVKHADAQVRETAGVMGLAVERQVKGSRSRGVRPYVYFEGARYTSPMLAQAPHLIGCKVRLDIDTNEVRVLKAHLRDSGQPLGELRVQGFWADVPHTLWVRRLVRRHARDRKLEHENIAGDPIHQTIDHYNRLAARNKRAAKRLVKLRHGVGQDPTTGKWKVPPPKRTPRQPTIKNRFLRQPKCKLPMTLVL